MWMYVTKFIQTLLVRKRFFFLYIDDFKRKTCVYFSKEKYNAFSVRKTVLGTMCIFFKEKSNLFSVRKTIPRSRLNGTHN